MANKHVVGLAKRPSGERAGRASQVTCHESSIQEKMVTTGPPFHCDQRGVVMWKGVWGDSRPDTRPLGASVGFVGRLAPTRDMDYQGLFHTKKTAEHKGR